MRGPVSKEGGETGGQVHTTVTGLTIIWAGETAELRLTVHWFSGPGQDVPASAACNLMTWTSANDSADPPKRGNGYASQKPSLPHGRRRRLPEPLRRRSRMPIEFPPRPARRNRLTASARLHPQSDADAAASRRLGFLKEPWSRRAGRWRRWRVPQRRTCCRAAWPAAGSRCCASTPSRPRRSPPRTM